MDNLKKDLYISLSTAFILIAISSLDVFIHLCFKNRMDTVTTELELHKEKLKNEQKAIEKQALFLCKTFGECEFIDAAPNSPAK